MSSRLLPPAPPPVISTLTSRPPSIDQIRPATSMASRMVPRLLSRCSVRVTDDRRPVAALLCGGRNHGRALSSAASPASSNDNAAEVERSDSLSENRSFARSNLFPDIYNPFRFNTSLSQMLDAVDRIFDIPLGSSLGSRLRTPWDVMEDDKAFKLRMDMPGITKEELKIWVEDGDLVVKGEHSTEEKEEDWSSRSCGVYNTRISLPDNIQVDQIKAELKNGVLKVTAPKTEAKKHVMDVQVS